VWIGLLLVLAGTAQLVYTAGPGRSRFDRKGLRNDKPFAWIHAKVTGNDLAEVSERRQVWAHIAAWSGGIFMIVAGLARFLAVLIR
jgi:hypothetical protein